MENVWLAVALVGVYVFAVIGLAEALRAWAGWETPYTRKVVHIGVGMLIWLVPLLFRSWQPFVLLCLLFAGVTFLDNRRHFFRAMASRDDRTNQGTFYFPLAAAAVVWWFDGQPGLLVAALMPLTWGDGMAEVIGRLFGRNPYRIARHTRTLEGSAAFFAFTFATVMLSLLVWQPPAVTFAAALLPAFLIALTTTAVEAVTIAGLDNLTVTVTAVLLLTVWPF
jgi:dolichol kinase